MLIGLISLSVWIINEMGIMSLFVIFLTFQLSFLLFCYLLKK